MFLHVTLAVFCNICSAHITESAPTVNRFVIGIRFLIDDLDLFGFGGMVNRFVNRIVPRLALVRVADGRFFV